MALEAIDFLRFESSDYFQYWTAVVPEPPLFRRVPFVNVVLRPDGLLIDHLTPPVALSVFDSLRPLDPTALLGSEPNVTYCLNDLVPPAPLADGALARMAETFPRLILPPMTDLTPGMPHPAFSLGSPADLHWGPAASSVCVPDRLAPLRSGSLLRGLPPPDEAFASALGRLVNALELDPLVLDYGELQAVAALGAGLPPPPPNHGMVGLWRPNRPAEGPSPGASLVISLSLVGARLPQASGFVRGVLPSGWVLFQRRAPALHPYVLNDYARFARLASGYPGPIVLVAGHASTPLPSFFFLADLPQFDVSPYVPLVSGPPSDSGSVLD